MKIDTATVRYSQRRRLGEYEHHEAEASFSLRPDAEGSISEQQIAAGMEQARQVVLGAIAGKTTAKQPDLPPVRAEAVVSAPAAEAAAPRRGRPPKRVADPLDDLVGITVAPDKQQPVPVAPGVEKEPAFTEEDLKKAAVAASGVITPLGVKAVIKEFGGVLLSTIPADKRAVFIARLDAEVSKARGGR